MGKLIKLLICDSCIRFGNGTDREGGQVEVCAGLRSGGGGGFARVGRFSLHVKFSDLDPLGRDFGKAGFKLGLEV